MKSKLILEIKIKNYVIYISGNARGVFKCLSFRHHILWYYILWF